MIQPETTYHFVGQRRFTRTAGAGDAEYRHAARRGCVADLRQQPGLDRAVFERGDETGQRGDVVAIQCFQRSRCIRARIVLAALEHVGDHALQSHALTVFRGIDPGNAVVFELADFSRDDDPATASENANVGAIVGA